MTEKKSKNLVGTIITLTELQKNYLQAHVDKRCSAESILEVAGEIITKARALLWEHLFDFHPEIKDYHCNYDSKTGEMDIIGKRRKKK